MSLFTLYSDEAMVSICVSVGLLNQGEYYTIGASSAMLEPSPVNYNTASISIGHLNGFRISMNLVSLSVMMQ